MRRACAAMVLAMVAAGCGDETPVPVLGFDLPVNRDAYAPGGDDGGADVPERPDVFQPVDPGRDPGIADPGPVDPGTDPGAQDPGPVDPGQDPGTDPGPIECQAGGSREVPCGLNGRGMQRQVCVEGRFQDFGDCIDPDVCTDEDELPEACGLNGRGVATATCVAGAWVPGDCVDPDECQDGDARTVACGTGGAGSGDQECVEGAWTNDGGCRNAGRWQCVEGKCRALHGATSCGNGSCEPKTGESPQSCPADCGGFAGTSGQDARCRDGFDCIFYDWPLKGYGYWECAGIVGRRCEARGDPTFCGTAGQDYCYFTQNVLESDQSCPLDCPDETLACDGDYNCIWHPWPVEAW